MESRRKGSLFIIFSVLWLVAACANPAPPPATPTPARTATPQPTPTPQPTVSPPSTLTPTVSPTPTLTLTSTPSPTPTPQRVSLGLVVAARRAPIVMRLDEARLEGDALTVELAFVNSGARDLQGPMVTNGGDAILVADGQPQTPREVTPNLAIDLAPVGVWGMGEANRGALSFYRPKGATATLRLPGFPPVQIDFRAGSAVALADDGGPLPTPTPNTLGQAVAEVRTVLSHVADAVMADAPTQLEQLILPQAAAYFGSPHPFEFAHSVPFHHFDLELFSVDLNRPGVVERRDDAQPVALRGALVALVFAFDGAESEVYRQLLTVDFERGETGWQLARIESEPPPFWAVGLTATTRSPHFLAFHQPGQDMDEILAAAEQAHANLVERLGELVDPFSILVAPPTGELYSRVTQQSSHSFIGQARFNNLLTPTGITPVSRALYINEAVFRRGGLLNTRVQTVQHELTHLTLSRWSRPWTPPWLIEGAAGVFSGEPNKTALTQFLRTAGPGRISLASLTGLDNLEQGPVPIGVAYAYSTAVSQTLIDEYGQARYLDFYRAFTDISLARAREAAGDGASVALDRFHALQRAATDETLAKIFNLTLADLEAKAEARMMENLGK